MYNAIQRSNHIRVKTKKIPQTDSSNLFHRQARYNWFCQLLARMGHEIPTIEGSEFRNRLKNEWIDYDKLKEEGLTFDLEQVAFWDEIHISQVIGCKDDETLIFGRNDNGLYDCDAEIDENERRCKRLRKNIKFENQCRLSMGVCMKNDGGNKDGVRLDYFDYSSKNVLSIKKYNMKVKEQIRNIKRLTPEEARKDGWIVLPPLEQGVFYESDDLDRLRGVAKGKRNKLVKAGIRTIGQLMICQTREDMEQIAEASGLSYNVVHSLCQQAFNEVSHSTKPTEINYQKEDNPYKAQYGDNWINEIPKKQRIQFNNMCQGASLAY